jgi:hypothetical protein
LEYDNDKKSIAYATFGVKKNRAPDVIEEMEAYVRDELGGAPSFSLDSPKSTNPLDSHPAWRWTRVPASGSIRHRRRPTWPRTRDHAP